MAEVLIGVVTDSKQFNSATGKEMYSINMGETRFSGFGKSPASSGDTIEFEYKDSIVGDKVYKNITKVLNVKKVQTSGEIIGESAKAKRKAEMMLCATELVKLALKDEVLDGLREQKVAIVVNQAKVVWADLMRQIGEQI